MMRQPAIMMLMAASCLTGGQAAAEPAAKRKPGLWEIAVAISGQPSASKGQYCIDQADDLARTAGGGAPQTDCSESSVTAEGDGIAIASVCKQGNSTVTMTGLLSGDMNSAYQGQVTKKYSPPLYGRGEIKSTLEARYLGECK